MNDYDSIKEELLKNLKRYNLGESDKKTTEIYKRYLKNCIDFQQYVIGNLDTFKKAACVREAILECKIKQDEQENDRVAIDISVDLIRNPSCYIGETCDHEFKMEAISIEFLKENTFLWERYLEETLKSIQYYRDTKKKQNWESNINLDSTAANLELLYNAALISQRPDKYYEFPLRKEKDVKKIKQRKKIKCTAKKSKKI